MLALWMYIVMSGLSYPVPTAWHSNVGTNVNGQSITASNMQTRDMVSDFKSDVKSKKQTNI